MLTDLVISAFGAGLDGMVEIARAADEADVGAVWVTDHVDVGVLVANATNRHPFVRLLQAVTAATSRKGVAALGELPADLAAAGVDRHIVTVWPARDFVAVKAMRRR